MRLLLSKYTTENYIKKRHRVTITMASKQDILPKTIDSVIVQDGLKAVSILDGEPFSKDLCLVVGGTAVQSYLPDRYRRPTSEKFEKIAFLVEKSEILALVE